MTIDDSLNPLSIPSPDNRPGLSQITYRISDYTEFRRRLIERLPTALRPLDSTAGEAPLARLTTRAEDDPAIALLDAWAMVADVLTFYQERIANEGYLRTATERRSVLELARMIGYELSPGVAASTFLTFTVEDAPGSPELVTVPQGTAIMSVPAKDELPQTFETSQEFVARRAWNALTPRPNRPQTITASTRHLYLDGTSTQLQIGNFVLLLDDVPDGTLHILIVTQVETNAIANRTLIHWEPVLNPIQEPLRRPKLFTFRQSAALFGNQAPAWETMPAEIKLAALTAKGESIQGGVFSSPDQGETWTPVSQGLPNETITCLATKSLPHQQSLLFAGTPSKGVFRSQDHGQSWEAINSGLTNPKIQALYVDETGAILAGTPNGGVFRSRDNGENWVDIHTGQVRVEGLGGANWQSINTSLPATVVRSLLTYGSTTNQGTGRIYSEGTIVRGEGTVFTQELRLGDQITVNGQQKTVTRVLSDTAFTIDTPFIIPSLPPGTLFSARSVITSQLTEGTIIVPLIEEITITPGQVTTVTTRGGGRSSTTERIDTGTIYTDGSQVMGSNTVFQRLLRTINTGSNSSRQITIEVTGQIKTVASIQSNTVLFINSNDPFTRDNLDRGTPFLLPRSLHREYLIAGTDDGVYHSLDQGKNWMRIGLSDRAIYSLCYHTSYLIAGTDQGIYRSPDQGLTWEPTNLSTHTVFTLIADSNFVFAGTSAGIVRSDDEGHTWEPINHLEGTSDEQLEQHIIYALAIGLESTTSYLYAATNHRIFSTSNRNTAASEDVQWAPVDQIAVPDVTALIFSPANPDGTSPALLLAGTRFLGFTAAEVKTGRIQPPSTTTSTAVPSTAVSSTVTPAVDVSSTVASPITAPQPTPVEWPGFQIQDPTSIDLDTLYPQIMPGSWIVLVNDRDPLDLAKTAQPRIVARPVKTTVAISRSDFGLSSKITRLELESSIESTDPPITKETFGLRSTVVLVRSEELALALEPLTVGDRQHGIFNDPLPDRTVFLSRFIQELNPNQTVIVSGQRIRIQLEDVGGIFRSSPIRPRADEAPIPWIASNTGLSNSQVQAIALNPSGTFLLAGTTAGLFRSDNQGDHWEPLFTWDAISKTLKNPGIQALLIQDGNHILVGTAEGIFRSQDGGTQWQAINEGLEYRNIRAIALQANTLLLGTLEGGLFQSTDGGNHWTPTGLNMTDVQALAIQPFYADYPQTNPYWYAGTLRHGFSRSANAGVIWEQITDTRPGIGSISSRGTQVSGIGTQFAAQLTVGDIIHAAEQTRTIVEIQVSSDRSSQTLTLNAPFRPDLSSHTPFIIQTGLTNLNLTALAQGSRLGQGTLSIQNTQIRGQGTQFVRTLTVGDRLTVNGVIGTVTQIRSNEELVVDRSMDFPDQSPFLINEQLIFAGTAGSGVFRSWDRGDRWEPILTNLTDLEIRCLTLADTGELWVGTAQGGAFRSTDRGDSWISVGQDLSNLDVQAILLPSLVEAALTNLEPDRTDQRSPDQTSLSTALIGGIGVVRSPDTLYSTPVQRHDVLELLEPPIVITDPPDSPTALNGYWSLKLMDHQGFVGILTLLPTAFQLLSANPTGEIVSEVAVIQDPPTDQQFPVLTLQKPLRYSYDPATVQIYANVVEATQGETTEEVLGSGDGNAVHQQFALKKLPLTYVPAPTASGATSTLQVRVNGVLWREAPNLYGLTAQDQQYILRLEDDGTTIVTFGDGNKGARLLTGEENITATYRSGIGPEGNVGAGSLSILKTRPLGISEVINPLAATGAAPPERLELARVKAPPTVRTLDRIVSLQDFEDFARGFAGIGKAEAIALWNGDTQLVHITIAGIDGASVPEESNLYRQLLEAISRARDPIQAVEVDSYELILFNLEARLLIDPRYEAEVVQTQVLTQLQTTFSFEPRGFVQPVTASEAIAAMQQISGVIAVDLDALYQTGTSKALNQSLTALPARYDPQTLTNRPAQLLLLNINGIQLTLPPSNPSVLP